MLIDNVELFKTWLSKSLAPICDADPVALAKYVVALVKKDKPEQDLKDTCGDQLDVFLQDKTKEFVDNMFETLKNKSYLPVVPKTEPKYPVSSSTATVAQPAAPIINNATVEVKLPVVAQEPPQTETAPPKLENTIKESSQRKPSAEKQNENGRRRSRSRSPIKDRDDRRKRYDDRRKDDRERDRRDLDRRDNDRRGGSRYGRGDLRSELEYRRNRRSPIPPRRRSMTRSRSRSRERFRRSPYMRSRSRSPRPRLLRSLTRSRSRSRSRTRSRTRSRSYSPIRSRRYSPDSRGSTPIQDHGDVDYRYALETTVPSLSTIINVPPPPYPDQGYPDRPPPKPRCRDFDEKGFCMRGDLCQFDHGMDPVIVDDVSLGGVLAFPGGPRPPLGRGNHMGRGVPRPPIPGPPMPHSRHPGPPMRGARPTFPTHRPPPPIVHRPPPPPGTQGGYPPSNHPPPPGTVPLRGPPPSRIPPQERLGYVPQPEVSAYQAEPYNPETPAITNNYTPYGTQENAQQQADTTQADPVPYQPRERSSLVSIQTIPDEKEDEGKNEEKPSRTIVLTNQSQRTVYRGRGGYNGAKRGGHVYNRLGPKREYNLENTTLELRKIPPEYNNITKLNEHFSKFGTIVNLQIKHENDPGAALISYSRNAESAAAYHCPEPVLNNRFIKLFWHKKDKAEENSQEQKTGNSTVIQKPQKDPAPSIPPFHKLSINKIKKTADAKQVVVSPTGGLTRTVFNPSALKLSTSISTQLATQRAAVVEKKKIIQKEALKKRLAIQKQKQNLLLKQIEQQKLLILKLETNKNMSATDKASVMKTIKILSESIEKIRGELKTSASKFTPPPPPPVKSPKPPPIPKQVTPKLVSNQQAQKEILDTELDIISKQNEGADTTELRLRVAELKREAAALGLLGHGTGRGRGRKNSYRGRGGITIGARSNSVSSTNTVDHRPKQLLVAGFTEDEKEEVLQHFMSYGEVANVIHDNTVPSMIMEFKTRHGAEQAVVGGQHFGTKSLVMSWYQPPANNDETEHHTGQSDTAVSSTNTGNVEDDGGLLDDEEDELALEEDTDVAVMVDGLEGDEVDEVDEEVLLGMDEEEDDEDVEDRSWRR